MVMFNSYVSLPEGRLSTVMLDYQRVHPSILSYLWSVVGSCDHQSPVEVELLLYMGLLGN